MVLKTSGVEHPLFMADLVNSLGFVSKSGIAVVLGKGNTEEWAVSFGN